MLNKRIAVLAVMALVAMAASQPANAGVGGCLIGVGGCGPGGWHLTANPTVGDPGILDNLRGLVPAHLVAYLKAQFDSRRDGRTEQPADPTINGVGGCNRLIGVGGCNL